MSRRKVTFTQRQMKKIKKIPHLLKHRFETSRSYFVMPALTIGVVLLWQFVIAPVARLPYDTVSAEAGNLLTNGDFNQWSNRNPSGWQIVPSPSSNLQYTVSQTVGHIDGSGLYVDVGDYNSGSLQIISPEIGVSAGESYFFKSIYKTDTSMALFAKTTNAKGLPSYQLLKELPDYDYDWSSMSATIIVPKDGERLQVIAAVTDEGYAELDGAYLVSSGVTATTLPGYGKKQPFPGVWSLHKDGSAVVDGVSDGGSHIMTIAEYRDGSYGWKSAPYSVKSNEYYGVDFNYQSDAPVQVWADFKTTEGKYVSWLVGSLPPSTYWSDYTVAIETPTDASALQFSLQLNSVGTLKSRDVFVQKRFGSKAFRQPFVSVTFDDGWRSSKENGEKVLNEFGYKGTYYINPGHLGGPEHMTEDDVRALLSADHQIGSHTNKHIDISSYDHDYIKKDVQAADAFLAKNGIKNIDFASPYGKYDFSILPYIMSQYRSHRGTEYGVNTKQNFNPANLKGFFIRKETTDTDLRRALAMAKQSNGWLVLIYHKIEPSDSPFDVDTETFRRHMQIVRQSQLDVDTVGGVLDRL